MTLSSARIAITLRTIQLFRLVHAFTLGCSGNFDWSAVLDRRASTKTSLSRKGPCTVAKYVSSFGDNAQVFDAFV